MENERVTIAEAAASTGVTATTIYRMIFRGELEASKPPRGGLTTVSTAELKEKAALFSRGPGRPAKL